MESTRLTPDHAANDQLLYFTSSSLTSDDRHLVFISDRTGHPNLFALDRASGEERQLTNNTEGALKSYVYFRGREGCGFGKASVSLHEDSGTAYYLQGRQVCRVDLMGQRRVLAELPEDQVTAFTHVSSDGRRLCVPTTDARALEADRIVEGTPDSNTDQRVDQRPSYNIDERVQREGLNSYLKVFDTQTGEMLLNERVPRAWITHVQFHPTNPDWILYNHEWPSDCGIRRVWLWDGHQHRRMRTEGEGRSRDDWACHEVWEKDGQRIVYHGGYHNGPYFMGRVNVDGSERVEIALPEAYRQYGHFTLSPDGRLVSDGYYRDETSGDGWGGEWISVQKVDWQAQQMAWRPLCKHGSNWDSQDSHPHPIFNHVGDAILFTSNKEGHRAVYEVRGF